MAYNKRTWKKREGAGLAKYTFNGITDYLEWCPDEITREGTEVTADALNDWETRIQEGFNRVRPAQLVPNPSDSFGELKGTINKIRIIDQVYNIPPYSEESDVYRHKIKTTSGTSYILLFINTTDSASYSSNITALTTWLNNNGYTSSSNVCPCTGVIGGRYRYIVNGLYVSATTLYVTATGDTPTRVSRIAEDTVTRLT